MEECSFKIDFNRLQWARRRLGSARWTRLVWLIKAQRQVLPRCTLAARCFTIATHQQACTRLALNRCNGWSQELLHRQELVQVCDRPRLSGLRSAILSYSQSMHLSPLWMHQCTRLGLPHNSRRSMEPWEWTNCRPWRPRCRSRIANSDQDLHLMQLALLGILQSLKVKRSWKRMSWTSLIWIKWTRCWLKVTVSN